MLEVATERAHERGWSREVLDVIATAIGARQAIFGWILFAVAVVHSMWAASVYPEATMGVGAVLLTAVTLLAGAILVRRAPAAEQRA